MDKDSKKLLIFIAMVIGLFALSFLVRFVVSPTAAVVTIDGLHMQNLEGKEVDGNHLYNGFSFVLLNGLWYTQVQVNGEMIDIPLHYSPRTLESIPVSGRINKFFDSQDNIYITFDPTDEPLGHVALSSAELSLNLVSVIDKLPIAACIKNETDACKDRPIVTCDDEDKAVIFLDQTTSAASLRLEGNCITLAGDRTELVKATNRLLYKWYSIMD